MPLIIPKTLPAYDALYEENVFVMHRERAASQHIRPLEILILNLMPTKIATETQIARLLANTPLQVHMTLLQTASHAATHVSAAHLEAFYKTFEEVVANKYPVKMVIKKNGSFGEQTAEKVCEALGITFDDIESWGGKVEKTGGDAIKSGLQDDLYDMTIDHIGKGQSNTTELCLTHDMYDVELNEDTRKKLCEMGYTPVTVEAGTWNKQDRDVETVGSQQCLLVDANMDPAVAYTLTKAICEGREAMVASVAALEYFDPTVAGGSGYTGCPLHPGAKAYYEEMGYACD